MPKPDTDSRVWTINVCSIDGYTPGNRGNWCAGGCGRDYNEMERVRVVPESRALEAERQYGNLLEAGQTQTDAFDRCRVALAAAEARVEELTRGLRRIADHDWTEPPTLLPDEMAREVLNPAEQSGAITRSGLPDPEGQEAES